MRKIIKCSLFLVISTLFSASVQASTITLLDIGGPDTDFVAINSNESAGIAFTLNQSIANLVITPNVFCLNCTGRFVLMQDNVGSDATLSDLVYAEEFDGGQAGALNFNETLDAATYFLIFVVDSGSAGWISSDNATVFESAFASVDLALFSNTSNTDTTFPGASNFTALFGTDVYLTVSGTPVPLPAAFYLLASGLIGLFFTSRQQM